MHGISTTTSSRLDILRFRAASVGALLAAGLLVLASAPLFPASAAVTCDAAWVQGTLDEAGAWTAGAGTDHRLACTGDTDGDVLMTDDVPDPPEAAERLVIDVSDSNVDRVVNVFGTDVDDRAGAFRIVLTGSLGSSGGNNFDVAVQGFEVGEEGAHFAIESYATIDATGGGNDGIQLSNSDAAHTGTMEAINRGAITTGGTFGYGIDVVSESSSARAVNAGTIATGGDAGRGVVARVLSGSGGTAIAINRGTVTTTGDIAQTGTSPNIFFIPSDGVRAINDGMGDAEATNEHGGTVTVGGDGARGVSTWAGAGGTARATNRGEVTAGGGAAANLSSVFGVGASSRDGDAFAENAAGGTVVATGAGGRGLVAFATSSATGQSGVAEVTNAGSIETRGDAFVHTDSTVPANSYWRSPAGMLAQSEHENATARNLASGTVETRGLAAHGIFAIARRGDAAVDNAGTIITHTPDSIDTLPGTDNLDIGSRGVYALANLGDASIVNQHSGSVTTMGARAFGLLAWVSNDGSTGSATATVRNKGRVNTEGDNADGVIAFASIGGTMDNANTVRAYNEAGGSIATAGDAAGGLGAAILVPGGGGAFGSAFAQNDGTITTAGGPGGVTGDDLAFGMSAVFFNNAGEVITDAGDVEARNTGTITVSGARAQGIRAATFGDGSATVVADGGRVTATYDSDADDDRDGVGIYASSGTGPIAVSILNHAVIEAPQAVLLENAPATLALTNSVVRGRVSFGDGNDNFTIDNAVLRGDIATGDGDDVIRILRTTTMTGDIDFGAGEDTLILDVSEPSILTGAISNLETLNKMCPGDFVIDGDITFAGSAVVVNEGGLVITGHMNLGTGTVDVHDGTRLTALLTETGTPRITAGMTTVHEGGAVVVEAHADAGETDAGDAVETLLGGANVQGAEPLAVQTRDSGDSFTQLATFDPGENTATVEEGAAVGTRPEDTFLTEDDLAPPSATADSGGGGGGGGGNSTVLSIGSAGLLAALFLLFDSEPDEPAAAASLKPAFVQTVDGSSRHWVRNLGETLSGNGVGSASGIEVGMDVAVGNGFTLGFVAAPDMAVEQENGPEAAALSGGRYSLRGGWQGETLFGKFSLSQAGWRVSDAYRNPTVGGGLSGSYDARQTDLQLGLGTRVDLGEGLTLTPRMGAFAGELDREGHTARGPVFHAAMPDVVQRYGGWKMGLGVSSAWQQGPGELKLRPSLKLSAARAWTDSPGFDLKQSDRLGIVSTTSRVRLAGAPGTVFGLGAGLDAVDANGIRMGIGYVSAVMDGKLVHAAVARMKVSF